ncbi:MAG TPA: hypothetical protein VF593_02610 [Chthoniobacteraceae bacterium]|jgi:hypothetical protein
MKTLNPRIERLKQMMALEERRAVLQQELDSLSAELSSLKDGLFDDSAPAAAKSTTSKSTRTAAKPERRQRNRRGLMKDKIMAALEAAGSAGIKVKELAQVLGTKPVNIHSWFHSALKRENSISKVSGGHYRLNTSGGSSSSSTSSAKPAREAKPAARSKRRGGTRRGELSTQILEALKSAGPEGISVADLATQMNAKYKNIYIWFATTGKKQKSIKKLGPARYSLVS